MILKITKSLFTPPGVSHYFSCCSSRWFEESSSGKLLIVYRELILKGLIPSTTLISKMDLDRRIDVDGRHCWQIYLLGNDWYRFAKVTLLRR